MCIRDKEIRKIGLELSVNTLFIKNCITGANNGHNVCFIYVCVCVCVCVCV